ncbi:MAG: DUF262 domain-containing protein [Prevotellaceae bacterium]|nr:DUF262 domain-containing protein [Prevotellaceae bacterium]
METINAKDKEVDTGIDIDIEQELKDENIVIDNPFNPNDIKVSTQPLTLGDLIERLEYKEIKLNSEFQRLPDLWNDTKKSRLIESVLLRLPVPTFYFDGSNDNKWEVIDGLQRISTLRSFVINKTLKLENLQFLREYNGCDYGGLPRELQRRIKTFPITVYILEKGTPDEVKYNIFSRLNQGGLELTPQELRNALHQGAPATLVAELVRGKDEHYLSDDEKETIVKTATEEGKLFVKVTEGRIPIKRMEDRDFATRFVAFYLTDYNDYMPDMDTFMSKGMKKIYDLTNEQIMQLKSAYKKALNTAFVIFGNDAFRKRYQLDAPRKPINKALFDSISVSFAKLSDEQCESLISKKNIFRDKLIALHNSEDGKFLRSLTQGTALKVNVLQRFTDINNIINETLNNV